MEKHRREAPGFLSETRMTTQTSVRLSFCIPVYNFGPFVGQTLDSILGQPGMDEAVEVLVVDGASTDNTEEVVGERVRRWPNLRYVKLPKRGGIDADLAESVSLASGEYCSLFSGDDLMLEGALPKALNWLDRGHDVYICKHANCDRDMRVLNDHAVFRTDEVRVAELSDHAQRLAYLTEGITSEALFSFMSGLIVRREKWLSVESQDQFMGSCWAHVARLLAAAQVQLRVCYVGEVWLDRRGDNDSFLDRGIVNRLRIAVDGYQGIAHQYFGKDSEEAAQVRRLLRNDLKLPVWMYARRRTLEVPELENRKELDRLMDACFSDPGLAPWLTRNAYRYAPLTAYRIFLLSYHAALRLYRLAMARN